MTNKKLERLLVIEDTPSHLNEAKKFLATIHGLKTKYAPTVNEALGDSSSDGKLYRREPSHDNEEWDTRMEEFKREKGFPEDFTKLKEDQRKRIHEYGKQLEMQSIPRTIRSRITPLVDGVITDLFFPMGNHYKDELNEGPNGLIIAATCQRMGIPYVVCTAGFHHGKKYAWASQALRAIAGEENKIMIDCYEENNPDAEGQHKNWKDAYETLRQIIEGH